MVVVVVVVVVRVVVVVVVVAEPRFFHLAVMALLLDGKNEAPPLRMLCCMHDCFFFKFAFCAFSSYR